MSKKYRYRVRVVYDAILESDFPDDFTQDDVKSDIMLDIEEQDVLFFGSDFDPDVEVSGITCTHNDGYEVIAANGETANILVDLKVSDNLYCSAELEVEYSVDSCDEGSYDITINHFEIVDTDFHDEAGNKVCINVDIKPLIDSTKIEEAIRSRLDRGVH